MWDDTTTPISEVKEALDAFNEARDWGQFHTPKDLAMCISTEAAELLECFLWKSPDDSLNMDAVREELADIFITATNLANKLGVDIMSAVEQKLEVNGRKYPVEKAKGRSTKHDKL